MAETLRELVVALSLDSSNFSRNMRTINQQISGKVESSCNAMMKGRWGTKKLAENEAGTNWNLSLHNDLDGCTLSAVTQES